jgi:dephospho-CoA kinase
MPVPHTREPFSVTGHLGCDCEGGGVRVYYIDIDKQIQMAKCKGGSRGTDNDEKKEEFKNKTSKEEKWAAVTERNKN